MKANTIGNVTLFLLSAGCLTLTAFMVSSRQSPANANLGSNNGALSEQLATIESRMDSINGSLSKQLATIESRMDSINGSLAKAHIGEGARKPNESQPNQVNRRLVPGVLVDFLEKARTPGSFDKLDVTKAQMQRRDLIAAINSLDARHKEEIRDEIAKANWVLEILETRAVKPPFSHAELISRLVMFRTLNESAHVDVSQDLISSVTEGLKQSVVALKSQLDETTRNLKDEKPVPDKDLRAALLTKELLDEAEVPGIAEQAEVISQFLRISEWERLVAEQAGPDVVLQSPDELPARRIVNLLGVGNAIRDQIANLGYTPPAGLKKSLDRLDATLSKCVKDQQSKQTARYQEWALMNIKLVMDSSGAKASEVISNALDKCKDDPENEAQDPIYADMLNYYPTFRKELAKQTGLESYNGTGPVTVTSELLKSTAEKLYSVIGWKGQAEMAKALVKDLIVVRLLVIDESQLERPVANLYSEAFETCWKYLEGTDYRVAVASESATVQKLHPEDLSKP